MQEVLKHASSIQFTYNTLEMAFWQPFWNLKNASWKSSQDTACLPQIFMFPIQNWFRKNTKPLENFSFSLWHPLNFRLDFYRFAEESILLWWGRRIGIPYFPTLSGTATSSSVYPKVITLLQFTTHCQVHNLLLPF